MSGHNRRLCAAAVCRRRYRSSDGWAIECGRNCTEQNAWLGFRMSVFRALITRIQLCNNYRVISQSQRPRGLRRSSTASHLLRLWVRIPPGAWMFVVRQRSLRRADHSSRGALPSVGRRCVWSRNLVNEEAVTHWGLLAPKTQTNKLYNKITFINPSAFVGSV